MRKILALAILCFTAPCTPGALTEFDLGPVNAEGAGMHGGNYDPPRNTPATGGERGSGITYDDLSKVLTLNVAWGTDYGYQDLQGTIRVMRIAVVSDPALPGEDIYEFYPSHTGFWGASQKDGYFAANLQLVANPTYEAYSIAEQEADLFAGKWYLNLHTSMHLGGEIKGTFTPAPVPEPAEWGLLSGMFLLGCALARRRFHRTGTA